MVQFLVVISMLISRLASLSSEPTLEPTLEPTFEPTLEPTLDPTTEVEVLLSVAELTDSSSSTTQFETQTNYEEKFLPNIVSCQVSLPMSTAIIIVFSSIYIIVLITVSVYSYANVHDNWNRLPCHKEFKAWCQDIWKRRRCYLPIVAHIFDQITDLSVVIQFYQLANTKYHNDWSACNGLNMWYLFCLSVGTLIVYRIISAYLVFQYTNKKWKRAIYQLFDIELFIALHTNYVCGIKEPSNPQRWITAMEAALESTPQALIQLVYLVNTHGFEPIIIISLLSSIWSIIAKLNDDDKTIVHEYADARGVNIKIEEFRRLFRTRFIDGVKGFFMIILIIIVSIFLFPIVVFIKSMDIIYYTGHEFVDYESYLARPHSYQISRDKRELRNTASEIQSEIVNNWRFDQLSIFEHISALENPPLSWFYVLRFSWRFLDVTSRLFMMVLIWTVIGGISLTVIIFIECTVCVLISIQTKHWEFLFSVVALAVSLGDKTKRISGFLFLYRTTSNIILLVLVGIWLFNDFECSKCTDYVHRVDLARDVASSFRLFVYCCCAVIISPILFAILIQHRVFKNESATSRDLNDMLKSKPMDHDGILELQIYVGSIGIYDEKNEKCLLGLAFQFQKKRIIKYLQKQILLMNNAICEGDLLDVLCENKSEFDQIEQYFLCIYKMSKTFSTKHGTAENAYWCAISLQVPVGEMIKYDISLIEANNGGGNLLDHYRLTPEILNNEDLQYIYYVRKRVTDKQGDNVIICAAEEGNEEVVQKLTTQDVSEILQLKHKERSPTPGGPTYTDNETQVVSQNTTDSDGWLSRKTISNISNDFNKTMKLQNYPKSIPSQSPPSGNKSDIELTSIDTQMNTINEDQLQPSPNNDSKAGRRGALCVKKTESRTCVTPQ